MIDNSRRMPTCSKLEKAPPDLKNNIIETKNIEL